MFSHESFRYGAVSRRGRARTTNRPTQRFWRRPSPPGPGTRSRRASPGNTRERLRRLSRSPFRPISSGQARLRRTPTTPPASPIPIIPITSPRPQSPTGNLSPASSSSERYNFSPASPPESSYHWTQRLWSSPPPPYSELKMEVNQEQPRVDVETQTDPYFITEELVRTTEKFHTEIQNIKNFLYPLSDTLANIVTILTNMNRNQIRPRYSVTCAVPDCGNEARVVASCSLMCPHCLQCSAANPEEISPLRLPHCRVCGEVANFLLIRSDIATLRALGDHHEF